MIRTTIMELLTMIKTGTKKIGGGETNINKDPTTLKTLIIVINDLNRPTDNIMTITEVMATVNKGTMIKDSSNKEKVERMKGVS